MAAAATAPNTGSLLLLNGKIFTGAKSGIVEALAVTDGKVTAVGTTSDMKSKYEAQYNAEQILDLRGRTVVPGLIDGHLHVIREGLHFNLELRWDGVRSLKDGLAMIREQARRTPKGQWVRVVGGWCEHQFSEKRLPTLAELDEAGEGCPVFVLHLYDCALVNRVGLALLGYTAATPNPPSGEIVRDAEGNPTGLLIARPNAFLLYNTLNLLPKMSFAEQMSSTEAYQYELHRFGLTSVLDPGGGFQNYPNDYAVVQELDKQNKLTLRIAYSLFPQKPGAELDDFKRWSKMVKPGQGSSHLYHLGAGEMLAFSAADFEDFKEPRPDLPRQMEQELEEIVDFLVSIDWPFRLHATYGESIERELAVFEKIAAKDPSKFKKLRWFIDHAETVSRRDLDRIHALGGGVAIQHRMAFQGEYFAERYGAQAAENAPPIGEMKASQVHIGAGTDGTRVATYNPWVSLYWLITGRTVGGMDLKNAVSREEALTLWTHANAWFTREETTKGLLQPGYLADFAVLAEDYFSCSEERVRDMEALLTVVGGRVVFDRRDATEGTEHRTVQPQIIPDWSPVKRFGGYQLTSTRAWTATTDSLKPLSDHSAASGPAAAHLAPNHVGLAHAPVNPMHFFEHGHDC